MHVIWNLPMINNAIIKYMESACMLNLTRLEISIKKCTNQQRKKQNWLRENGNKELTYFLNIYKYTQTD